jgi:trimethylamine--corrinoid protein Co-methyltransferase
MSTAKERILEMVDRMPSFSENELNTLHSASLEILANIGVMFKDADVLSLFKTRGFRVDGHVVFLQEKEIRDALETAPARFKLTARNAEKSVFVGEHDWVLAPTYGSPFVCTPDGGQRPGTIADYENFCKLVQTSDAIDVNGYKLVEPSDVPARSAYLDMLFANLTLCDKPFMGSTDSREAVRDSIDMAAMVFGDKTKLSNLPVMVGLINSLSPLQYSAEMAGAIIELARYRQPMIIANMMMGGTSGPVKLPGLLALMNAEILAGLTLAQLAGPGTPVIYGSTSCPTNMRTGGAAVGSPEAAIIASATIQMARFYGLPSRTGGSLTDALVPDAQALAEGTLLLSTAVRSGANFILHACGMMGTYIAISFEKWLIDEELCGMLRRMLTPLEIAPAKIGMDEIQAAGVGGNFLLQPTTLACCRTEFFPYRLFNKDEHSRWTAKGGRRVEDVAGDAVLQRLEAYEQPEMDPALAKALTQFVARRKKELLGR